MTNLEYRLLESLKEHVHAEHPTFCTICYAATVMTLENCECDHKRHWLKAMALIKECEQKTEKRDE